MPAEAEYSSVAFEDEAIDLIDSLIDRQLGVAAREQTSPNAPAPGDVDVRTSFWLLLSLPAQRALFLRRARNRDFWPRIRSLIGAPPYAFLKVEDDGVLNAAGIAAGRVHMASTSTILGAHEIGKGQFVDEADRVYRHVADDTASKQIPTRRVLQAKRVVLDVRVAVGMRSRDRLAILKSRDRQRQKSVVFPRSGERVTLLPHGDVGGDAVSVTVRTVEAKSPASPVARLYCTL